MDPAVTAGAHHGGSDPADLQHHDGAVVLRLAAGAGMGRRGVEESVGDLLCRRRRKPNQQGIEALGAD
jgi:hypothetical protein